ncbi:MAG: lipopolysaccharide kinase InaA family protein [Myxococcota bacterium]
MSALDSAPIEWLAGEPALRRALDEALGAAPPCTPTLLRSNPRRTLHATTLPPSNDRPAPLRIVLKTHHLATGRHPLRDALKRRVGRSPARREWQALVALHAAGVPVPRPLAYGRLASGDELVVQGFVPGRPLVAAFAASGDAGRTALVDALARTLDDLARAGWIHGDLHLGNLRLVDPFAPPREEHARDGPVPDAHPRDDRLDDRRLDAGAPRIVLLDLERARRGSVERAALRDLARLELSLARAEWPIGMRRRLRSGRVDAAAFDGALRRFLADHRRGRARRARAKGGGLAAIRSPGRRGLREAGISEQALFAVLERAECSPLRETRRGGRTWIAREELAGRAVVVKGERAERGLQRLLARVRPSRAARAFRKGRLDRLVAPRAPTPLAFVEAIRARGATTSWLVLEHVGEVDLDRHRPATARAARSIAVDFADWLAELHAAGLGHRDLKGSNVRVALDGDAPRFWLVDLADLTGPARLRDDARLQALVELNASLADEDWPVAARVAALARYVDRLPFDDPRLDLATARREIARRARTRHHRFRGEGCGGSPRAEFSRR